MDNNEVYALFEDIKNDLKGINGKLENTPKAGGNSAQTMDLTPVKELLNASTIEQREQTKAILTKYGEAEVYASNRIMGLLRELRDSFVQREAQEGKSQKHIHRHTFDVKSGKAFSLLVGMGIACAFSVWGNIELWQSKRQYADDALKFRAIRSWGGCNANTILWLNEVFDIHRNEETIEWVRQEADGYDMGLKAVSDSLMQGKLKKDIQETR